MKAASMLRAAGAALVLCAVFAPARAQEPDEPPAAAAVIIPLPYVIGQREEQSAARALAERRQKMIDECERNHGSEVDCEHETDTELRAEGLAWRTRISPAR